MNISSENYGKARVTRHQNDAVTILDTATGVASSFTGGWDAWRKLVAELQANTKSGDEFRAAVESRLTSI